MVRILCLLVMILLTASCQAVSPGVIVTDKNYDVRFDGFSLGVFVNFEHTADIYQDTKDTVSFGQLFMSPIGPEDDAPVFSIHHMAKYKDGRGAHASTRVALVRQSSVAAPGTSTYDIFLDKMNGSPGGAVEKISGYDCVWFRGPHYQGTPLFKDPSRLCMRLLDNDLILYFMTTVRVSSEENRKLAVKELKALLEQASVTYSE
jgi:hypothetical protein